MTDQAVTMLYFFDDLRGQGPAARNLQEKLGDFGDGIRTAVCQQQDGAVRELVIRGQGSTD